MAFWNVCWQSLLHWIMPVTPYVHKSTDIFENTTETTIKSTNWRWTDDLRKSLASHPPHHVVPTRFKDAHNHNSEPRGLWHSRIWRFNRSPGGRAQGRRIIALCWNQFGSGRIPSFEYTPHRIQIFCFHLQHKHRISLLSLGSALFQLFGLQN